MFRVVKKGKKKYGKHLTNLCSGYGVDVMGLPVELVADVVIQRLLLVSSEKLII
jgi:hypothetical protein